MSPKKIKTIGILGVGQLGLMLAQSAKRHGLKTAAVAHRGQPIAQALDTFCRCEQELAEQADVLIFENEFVDFESLDKLPPNLFFPSLQLVQRISNKLEQKKMLEELSIPTAEYRIVENDEVIEDSLKQWGEGVLKWAEYGYDGHGTLICDSSTPKREIEFFFDLARQKGSKLYIEKKIPFKKELAMLCSFSPSGEFFAFPLVETIQKQGICFAARGPSTAWGVPESLEMQARQWMQQFAEHFKYWGCFAFEFFWDGRSLFVNEIAPRVHNSAHYTMDSHGQSQFDLHLKAYQDKALQAESLYSYFGMQNLLGPSEAILSDQIPEDCWKCEDSRFRFYWYGKTEIRPRRKMGHLNYCANSKDEFLKLESVADELIDNFWHQLRNGRNHV